MKNLKNLGTVLSKTEQQSINGGGPKCPAPTTQAACQSIGGW